MHHATPRPVSGEGSPITWPATRHPTARQHVVVVSDATAFDALVARRVAQCRRDGEAMAVLHLTLDTGAEGAPRTTSLQPLITDGTERLARCVRRSDLLVHRGGLHFGAMLPGADEPAAVAVGERLRYACSGPYQLGDRLLTVRLQVALQLFAPPHCGAGTAAALPTSVTLL